MKIITSFLLIVSFLAATSSAKEYDRKDTEAAVEREMKKIDAGVAAGPYKADWESLKKHNAEPEWFRDAKLGIYFHWGVYSVPAYGSEWYGRGMHWTSKHPAPELGFKMYSPSMYKHHVEKYGEPDEFGYHDFVPMFKAEHFDAEKWAELFKKAGAKFAGPVAEHHDGYSMWDSDITPWNAADTGPHRDIVGELEKAIRKQGMKFITTFHHERTHKWYPKVPGWPPTSDDPKLQMLYMNVPEDFYNKIFQAKLSEVIDKYKPDLIWFDAMMEHIQEESHLRFLAYYFNTAEKWGSEVVVTTKHHDYPLEIGILDLEKRRESNVTEYPWLTDDTITAQRRGWCYIDTMKLKTPERVLCDFIDIVSKNGCLFLNISPKADGTIPQDQQDILLHMGDWLSVNGEAIYNTRPWLRFGENHSNASVSLTRGTKYSAEDIRYTRSKDGKNLYAIMLGRPEGKEVILGSVQIDNEKTYSWRSAYYTFNPPQPKVTLLGYDKPLDYKINDKLQIVISLPDISEDQWPCKTAYTIKLSDFATSLKEN